VASYDDIDSPSLLPLLGVGEGAVVSAVVIVGVKERGGVAR
jgi:hypothetical protein